MPPLRGVWAMAQWQVPNAGCRFLWSTELRSAAFPFSSWCQTRADWDDLLQLPVRLRKTCNPKKNSNEPEHAWILLWLVSRGSPWLWPGTKISTPLLFSPALASSSPVAPVPAWSKDWKWSSDLQRFDKFEAIHWRALRLRRGRKLCTTSSPDICWDGTLARHFWTKGVLFDHAVGPSGWVWKWCISVYPLNKSK